MAFIISRGCVWSHPTELLIPSLPRRSVAMFRTSILKHSVRAAAAAVVLAGLLSPANATAIFPHPPTSAVPVHKPIVLTSRRPWIAPVGHRQPHQADVP